MRISPLPKSARTTFESMHKWAAVKSPLGAQTVLGDRHDPVCENFIARVVGRLRNSPERTFQRLDTQTDVRKHCRVKPLKWATSVVFRHWLPISSSRACQSRGACGTRPAEFFNGWERKQMCDRSEKRSSENLIRCQNLHEPLWSPCMFEPLGQISLSLTAFMVANLTR